MKCSDAARNPIYGDALFKSAGERRIGRLLDSYGVPYVYEPKVSVWDGYRTRVLLPDFHLPTLDTYVEYFGRAGNASYDRRVANKLRLYEQNSIPVVSVYPWDLASATGNAVPKPLEFLASEPSRRPCYGSVAVPCGYRPTRVNRGTAYGGRRYPSR